MKNSQILLDENGYVKEYALIGKVSNGQDFDNFPEDLDDFTNNYQSYKLINGILYKNENKAEELKVEEQKKILRNRRKTECFSYINRSSLWYNKLNEE